MNITRERAIQLAIRHGMQTRTKRPTASAVSASQQGGEWWVRLPREEPSTSRGEYVVMSSPHLTIAVDISSGKVRGPFGR